MKKRKLSKFLMMLITLFSSASVIVYITGFSLKPQGEHGVYSDTLYRKMGSDNNYTTVNAMENDYSENYQSKELNYISEEASKDVSNIPQNSADTGVNFTEISVYNHKNDSIVVLPLEEYVASVVVAEMPSNSPKEALKAQAVAVRTLAVNYILDSDKSDHKGADICTNSGHCQGFADKGEFIEKYGEKGSTVFLNAENATNATKDLILLYDNQPIIAVFHASSGESTASSKEVWGGDLAYLVSVETTEIADLELKNQVVNEMTFTRSELFDKLSKAGINDLENYKDSPFHMWISDKELTDSGRVAGISIAGTKFSGTKLRSILGLKSADFEISYGTDSITFITKGYGHGVGMSQLGAVAMAKNGESFYSILGKYYPGTVIGII